MVDDYMMDAIERVSKPNRATQIEIHVSDNCPRRWRFLEDLLPEAITAISRGKGMEK